MSAVQDFDGTIIELNDCTCGSEPEYFSANGIAHEVICKSCGRQTDMEICGGDAVWAWNSGQIYASAADCPIRGDGGMNRRQLIIAP